MSLKQTIAEMLAPHLSREAHAERRLRGALDEARWWLGQTHPEAASLAEYILDRERWYWSEGDRTERPWSPPEWVCSINTYRMWLDRDPFAARPAFILPGEDVAEYRALVQAAARRMRREVIYEAISEGRDNGMSDHEITSSIMSALYPTPEEAAARVREGYGTERPVIAGEGSRDEQNPSLNEESQTNGS